MSNIQAKRMLIFVIASMIILSTGCSKKPKSPSPKPGMEKKQSEGLTKLQTGVESLLKEFEKIYLEQTAPTPKAPAKEEEKAAQKSGEGQGQKSEEGQGQQGGGKGEGSQGGGGGGVKGGQEQSKGGQAQSKVGGSEGSGGTAEPDWGKLEESVTGIHEEWNDFQPEAAKAGAGLDKIDAFSRKLDELTISITQKDIYKGILSVSDLYQESIGFEKLFKTEAPPQLKVAMNQGKRAAYMALHHDDKAAKASIRQALKVWGDVRPQIREDKIAQKADHSIKELEQAIKAKDPNLIKIKAKILEKNFQDVIKQFKEKK